VIGVTNKELPDPRTCASSIKQRGGRSKEKAIMSKNSSWRSAAAVLALATATTLQACGSGSSTSTTGSIALSLAPTSATVQQGGSTIVTGTLTRTDFTGAVAVTVEGAPAGVTGTVALSGDAAAVTIAVTSTAVTGVYPLIIRAKGTGVTDATATFTLTITAASASSFTLLASPTSLNVAQGATNTTGGVKATRTGGFTGTITYSLAGAPTGVTAAFATTATTDSMQVSVTVTGAVAVGTYPAVIHGISGVLDVTTPITIIVTAGTAGSSVHLDYSACLAASKPIWVAFQDGSGAWTHVTGSADVYTFSIASATGAIAVVTPGANFVTTINYMSQTELAAFTGACAASATSKTVNGTLAGVTTGFLASISMGGGGAIVPGPATTFQLVGVASGSQDLVAYNRNSATPGAVSDGLVLRRNLNVADGGSVPLIDFGSVEAVAPTTYTITLTGATAGATITQVQSYLTGVTCTSHLLYTKTGTSATIFAYGVPAAMQLASDYYNLSLTSLDATGSSRQVSSSFHTLANKTIALGASVSVTVTDVTGASAYRRLQSVFTLPSDYQSATLVYTGVIANSVFITQSAGFIGGTTAVTLTMPDLAAAGYLASYGPGTANAVNYLTKVLGISGGGAGCNEGGSTKVATVTGIS
jgi:hypothetical protein